MLSLAVYFRKLWR